MRFFLDQRADFSMSKKNFPKFTLVYLNNGKISAIKNELAIYVNCLLLGQIIPALHLPTGIEFYQCKPNEVKIVQPLYGLSHGRFLAQKNIELCCAQR